MGIVVERTFTVSASPESVLDYLKDFGHTEQWDPGTVSTTRTGDGPIGVGTTWHNRSRVLGVSAELTYTLCEVEPGRLVFQGRNEGATATDTIVLRPAGAGTEITYHLDLEMHGLAKLATPVMRIEFERLGDQTAERLTGVLDRLAASLSSETSSET
jgi:carbon monoxide dehydrogenase subunit G